MLMHYDATVTGIACHRAMKRKPKPGLPRLFDRPKYRQRNVIERMFGWLEQNRRIVTRFDKLAKKLWRDGLAGLCHAVSATPVFRQNLPGIWLLISENVSGNPGALPKTSGHTTRHIGAPAWPGSTVCPPPHRASAFGRFLTIEAIQRTGQVQRKCRSSRLQMADQVHAIMQPGYSDACACWPEVPEGLHNGGE
jgi:hypothetical protein